MVNEKKVSAQELYELEKDTNEKVTALSGGKVKGRKVSKFQSAILVILMAFGLFLSFTLFYPPILERIGAKELGNIWQIIIVVYALVAVVFGHIFKATQPVKFTTTLFAIMPLIIYMIKPLI